MSKAQISMWEEKIVDSFAGGGGERQAWSLRPGHGAMDGDKHNQLHGAPRQ